MIIFPAIDLYEGKAVRLLKGDYRNMTVYSDDPLAVARDFERQGATYVHLVDLEGARDGAMRGTNLALYRELSESCQIAVTASGGVSTLADVAALRRMELYGAIVGKAYYTGAIDLRQAIEVAK